MISKRTYMQKERHSLEIDTGTSIPKKRTLVQILAMFHFQDKLEYFRNILVRTCLENWGTG